MRRSLEKARVCPAGLIVVIGAPPEAGAHTPRNVRMYCTLGRRCVFRSIVTADSDLT